MAEAIAISVLLPGCSDIGGQMSDAFVVLAPPHVSTVHARMLTSRQATAAAANLDDGSCWHAEGVRSLPHRHRYRREVSA